MAHHVLVNRSHRLVLFTIPKVGCTELIKLMRRLDGARDWRDSPHYKEDRSFLADMGLERAMEILNDPRWTKAAALRDPAERLLSAYLDKFVQSESYAANLFRTGGRYMPFKEFLGHVLEQNDDPLLPRGLHTGTDPHWRPQRLVGSLEKVAACIDLFGDFVALGGWIEDVLRRVGAWDTHGADGWGVRGRGAILETNLDPHRTGAGHRMRDCYDREMLEAVYEAYAGDLSLAASVGIDLKKHARLLS